MKIENLKKRFRFNVHVSPRFFSVKRFDVLILESCFLTVTASISKWDSIECVVFFLRICSALPPLKQWLNRKSRKQVGYAMHIWWQRNRQPNFVQQAQKVPLFMPRMLSTHTRSPIKVMCVLPASTLCLPFSVDSVNEHWRREKKRMHEPIWFHPHQISYIFAVHR